MRASAPVALLGGMTLALRCAAGAAGAGAGAGAATIAATHGGTCVIDPAEAVIARLPEAPLARTEIHDSARIAAYRPSSSIRLAAAPCARTEGAMAIAVVWIANLSDVPVQVLYADFEVGFDPAANVALRNPPPPMPAMPPPVPPPPRGFLIPAHTRVRFEGGLAPDAYRLPSPPPALQWIFREWSGPQQSGLVALPPRGP